MGFLKLHYTKRKCKYKMNEKAHVGNGERIIFSADAQKLPPVRLTSHRRIGSYVKINGGGVKIVEMSEGGVQENLVESDIEEEDDDNILRLAKMGRRVSFDSTMPIK